MSRIKTSRFNDILTEFSGNYNGKYNYNNIKEIVAEAVNNNLNVGFFSAKFERNEGYPPPGQDGDPIVGNRYVVFCAYANDGNNKKIMLDKLDAPEPPFKSGEAT